jgi:putative membrane protein
MGYTLIVSVDRDDDIGRKTGIKGPIIGKEDNLKVANALAIADPEDADVNVVFAALSMYEEIKKSNVDKVEIVTLTGNAKVGMVSDKIIAKQFEQVLAKFNVDDAILVSDGAEDEFIYPILSSRMKIVHVKRVYIRQNASVEGTYYLITKSLKDPKLRQKIIVPFSLILLVIAISYGLNMLKEGVVLISILLGIYLLAWAYSVEEHMLNFITDTKKYAMSGHVSFIIYLVAIALFLVGVLYSYKAVDSTNVFINKILYGFSNGFWWWVLSVWLYEMASRVDIIIEEWRVPRSVWVINTTIIAVSLTFWGLYSLISSSIGYSPETLPLIWVSLILGISVSIFAALLTQYFKLKQSAHEEE